MVRHNGYQLDCDRYCCEEVFESDAETRRTAITHAREARWAVVRIRLTAGAPKRTPSVTRVFCPYCKGLVGL